VDTGGSRDTTRRLAAARRDQWYATRRVAAARRERWGAAVSRRVARVVPRGCGGGDGDTQLTADARRRQIHPRDPLMYPREQTHATVRADRLLKKTRRC
jgi:hypothetical protein